MRISVNAAAVLSYAEKELWHFLYKYTTAVKSDDSASADGVVSLLIDETLEREVYSLLGDGKNLTVSGGSASAVLCGVYEALSDAGVFFDANGDCLPRRFDFGVFFSLNKKVCPKCRRRGIRQHLNFPMDISSYTLKDAKEYIRAIARMRFNAITFHSYADQFHAVDPTNEKSAAGKYFYGVYHQVPENPLAASRINNRRHFCIPEVEPIFDDLRAREEYTLYWLGEVIKTAKECCLEVTLSVELRSDDPDVAALMLKKVCAAYKDIDILELISHECGHATAAFGKDLTAENAPEKLAEFLGKEILSPDGSLEGYDGTLSPMIRGAACDIKRIITAIENKDKWYFEFGENQPELRVGLYIPDVSALRVLRPIVDKLIPADMTRSILPAYRALDTSEILEELEIKDKEWQNTMFYTWIEFDGDMFYQQMSTKGLEKTLFDIKSESVYGISANHWRTCENATCISYLAEALIAPLRAEDYFIRYAEKLGIGDSRAFADACLRLSNMDLRKLWGAGFCFVGCWMNGDQRINGVVRPFVHLDKDSELVKYTEGEYMGISKAYEDIIESAENPDAVSHLRLLANRCKTSAVYLESMCYLSEINKIYDYETMPEPDDEMLAEIIDIIERSRRMADDYMDLYGEILPDRGSEGMLSAHRAAAYVFIDKVAEHFSGYEKKADFFSEEAPPAPAVNDSVRKEN